MQTKTGTEKPSLAVSMPRTAAWIKQRRQDLGDAWVTDCVRRGMRGEPGCFFAMEAGHFAGTPFAQDGAMGEWQDLAVLVSTQFAGFLKEPEKAAA